MAAKHIDSQLQSLRFALSMNRLDFIGKLETFEENWDYLTNKHPKCSMALSSLMENKTHLSHSNRKSKSISNDKEIWENFDKELFDGLVEYFWQDFVCFGYSTNFDDFMRSVGVGKEKRKNDTALRLDF